MAGQGGLDGKVALVTGASSGIGREAARRLAADGASVVLAARRGAELDQLAAELVRAGHDAIAVPVDVTDSAQVSALVGTALEEYEQLDIVVNAAGIGILKPTLDLTEDDFDRMITTNLKGTFLVSQAAAAAMATRGGGTIVNLVGVLGRAPMASAAGYCASKYGVTGLTKAMALDLKRAGVRFALLYLGGVDSPFWDEAGLRVQRDKMLTIGEAADAVLYAARQRNGAVLAELVLQPENHQLL